MTIPANGKMGLVGASSLVVTNMVGTGLFLLPSSLATIGSISIYGWLVSAIGATALGLVFAHMGMVDPKAGGPVRVCARPHGPIRRLPDQHAVLGGQRHRQRRHRGLGHRLPGSVLPVLVQPWLSNACTALVIWTFIWLNTRGANTVGRFTTFTTAAGIIPIAVVGLLGWFWFSPDTFMQGWNPEQRHPAAAITSSASIALWAFLGVESAAVSAGVIENPRRNVPLAT
jgi:arginine:agmatine antiporter